MTELEGQERAWWTSAEIADAWEISERTLTRWLAAGRFIEGEDYTRSGGGAGTRTGQLLWTPAALPDWVEESDR